MVKNITMTPEQIEVFRTLLYMTLIPVEKKYQDVFKSSIKYAVVLDNEGNLVLSDWLNAYPEIKQEIEAVYNKFKAE